MKLYKPVAVSKAAFAFCRYSMMILLWLAVFLKIRWPVVIVGTIMLLSALFSVKNAPLILMYRYTIDKIFPSKKEILDEKAMRFAHSLATIFAAVCIILLYTTARAGWIAVFVFAIMKTISAIGACPATKLYGCMRQGGCCALTR